MADLFDALLALVPGGILRRRTRYRIRLPVRLKWLTFTGYRTEKKFPTLEEAIEYAERLDSDDVLVDTHPGDEDNDSYTLWDKQPYHVVVKRSWTRKRVVRFRDRGEALTYARSLPDDDVSVYDFNHKEYVWMKSQS
jgi:hypothetical protein